MKKILHALCFFSLFQAYAAVAGAGVGGAGDENTMRFDVGKVCFFYSDSGETLTPEDIQNARNAAGSGRPIRPIRAAASFREVCVPKETTIGELAGIIAGLFPDIELDKDGKSLCFRTLCDHRLAKDEMRFISQDVTVEQLCAHTPRPYLTCHYNSNDTFSEERKKNLLKGLMRMDVELLEYYAFCREERDIDDYVEKNPGIERPVGIWRGVFGDSAPVLK